MSSAFPPARWLREYQPKWLAGDLVAGVTLAAFALPVSLAYAGLAGLPPQVGLYGTLLGGVGYALFGSSRHLSVGPTSSISLMLAGRVAEMAGGDAVRYGQIASLAGLMVAALSLLAWALKLSTLNSFISDTILLGFKAGAGLTIAATQLASLIGVKGGGTNPFTQTWSVLTQLEQTKPMAALFGLSALVIIVLAGRLVPRWPVALTVVVAAIVIVSLLPPEGRDLVTVGPIAGGLPEFKLPGIRVRDVDGIIPLALGCLLLAYIEGVSAARAFAEERGETIDARQELLGLSAANLAVGLGGAYPVAGGLSQTLVNQRAGSRTPLSVVFASITIALCLLFLTGPVANLPKAVLAAIVLSAVTGLIKVKEILRLRRVSRTEFRVAMVALLAVLLLGILKGILVAAIASILFLLQRAARPRIAFLGRIPGTRRYSDSARHPDNEPVPGALLVRVESALLYFNVEHVLSTILARVRASSELRRVICDLSSSPHCDLAGARMLESLHDELARTGITLQIVEAHASVRELLRAEGLGEKVGRIDRMSSVADAVECAEPGEAPPAPIDRKGDPSGG